MCVTVCIIVVKVLLCFYSWELFCTIIGIYVHVPASYILIHLQYMICALSI